MDRPGALVVGGSGALGRAITRALDDRGFRVVATFCEHKPDGEAVRFDGRDAVAVAEAVDQPLRTVIYAAGVPSSKRSVASTAAAEFMRLFQVNAAGLAVIWQAVAPQARAGKASVVAISSDAARTATPGNGPYSASKAALESLALTLAKEEAEHGVRVNVVAPSIVVSPQADHVIALKGVTDPAAYYRDLPWGRGLSVNEVAEAVVSIAVDSQWQYTTGQIFRLAADIPRSGETR